MKAYYVNRADREDRNYLFRGAMAASGFRPDELVRVIAKHKEDYPTREQLCDAAADDGFANFFYYQRGQQFPGYGHLVCSWSVMRCWRQIAEAGEIAIHLLDDYYVKQKKQDLEFCIGFLDDLRIVQLAWHTRDDVFFEDRYKLGLPYKPEQLRKSEKMPEFYVGAADGCSDWAMVLSAEGAGMLLDYMKNSPYLNTECVITGMHHAYGNIPGLYSVIDNAPKVDGTVELQPHHNKWIGHLIEYTEHNASDLIGTHEYADT